MSGFTDAYVGRHEPVGREEVKMVWTRHPTERLRDFITWEYRGIAGHSYRHGETDWERSDAGQGEMTLYYAGAAYKEDGRVKRRG